MSETVNLPALGESVTEGTVTRWLKQVGDEVAVDEPLLEVSTDKVDTEVPSPVAGTLLEIRVQEDEDAEVGQVLAIIGSGSAPSGDEPTEKPTEKPAEKPAEKQPVAPPAPSRVTTRLIILFVILLAVFGLYIVWTQVLKKSNSDGTKTGTTTEPVTPPKPEVKPEPKPDPIKLAVTTPDVMTVKAEAAGTIERVTTEKAVKKDQVIIWLKGGNFAQAAFDRPKQAYDTAFKELDTARIALDAARATNAPNLSK